jgi:hypothetical protein
MPKGTELLENLKMGDTHQLPSVLLPPAQWHIIIIIKYTLPAIPCAKATNPGTKTAPPDTGRALQPPRAWAGCGRTVAEDKNHHDNKAASEP